MTEREFQIQFERQLNSKLPSYNNDTKLNSDTIFHYINRAKDEYIKSLYRIFQRNQEITDMLRILVVTKPYTGSSLQKNNNIFTCEYPEDYSYALGEQVKIKINGSNACGYDTESKYYDVLEATIETYSRILENSLSEYRLHYGKAKPVRLYTDNKIQLTTDGLYDVIEYNLQYLRKSSDLGKALQNKYEDLPEESHQDIVDAAVALYIADVATTSNSDKKSE